mmetsp:Transcript_35116/g.139334  ORF Transcript_35116/g.139334 Transcript_35116/m.139334 type:complete len:213 (+) Transcript_35116:1531-2169(+)
MFLFALNFLFSLGVTLLTVFVTCFLVANILFNKWFTSALFPAGFSWTGYRFPSSFSVRRFTNVDHVIVIIFFVLIFSLLILFLFLVLVLLVLFVLALALFILALALFIFVLLILTFLLFALFLCVFALPKFGSIRHIVSSNLLLFGCLGFDLCRLLRDILVTVAFLRGAFKRNVGFGRVRFLHFRTFSWALNGIRVLRCALPFNLPAFGDFH